MKQDVELIKIVEGCKKNDRVCQEQLFKIYYGKMTGVCLRYANDLDGAQDMVQEGFIKVFKSLPKYSGDGSLEGWIRRIITNTAIDAVRKHNAGKVVFDSEVVDVSNMEDDDESLTEIQGVTPQMIIDEIQNLTPQYKLVFNMYIMEGFTHREIAAELGISEGTSKSNLAKAKKKLKGSLLSKVVVNE